MMNRREFTQAMAAGTVLSAVGASKAPAQPSGAGASPAGAGVGSPLTVGMLVYSDMVMLDLVGPQTIFSLMNAKLFLVAKDSGPVQTDVGLTVQPTTTFDTCPEELDILFVPGGLKGTIAAMSDADTLDFLARRGARARYVTSVCTGGLLLAAAGLLRPTKRLA